MFGTIRRHQTWLWVVVATITIVSFIVYFNPASKSGGSGSRPTGNYGTINGHQITKDEMADAQKEVVLGHWLNRQRVDPDSSQVLMEAYQTLFLADKEEQLGIQMTPEAASAFAHRYILGKTPLRDFVSQILTPANLTEADFDRFLRHQAGLKQLIAVTGVSGALATEAEAESVFLAQNRELASQMVYFPYTNYLEKATNSPGEVVQFFSNNIESYAIPEKVVVDYVKFSASNYLATAKTVMTNLENLVSQVADEAGTNLPPGAKTPEEAKAKYREEILLAESDKLAGQAANNFALQLDQDGPRTNEMENLARTNGLVVHTTPPFDQNGPEDLKVPALFTMTAFRLTPDAPFSGQIPAEDGAYVLVFKERIPSKNPALKDIETKVAADLREAKARQAAMDAAAKFSAAVEDQLNVNNGVTLPKDFNTIAAENNVRLETLPIISLSSTNLPADIETRVPLALLRSVAFGTSPGAASKARSAPEGAFVLYVDKVLPADPAKIKSQLPTFLGRLRLARQTEAFELWVNNEMNHDPGLISAMQALEKEAPGAGAPKSQK